MQATAKRKLNIRVVSVVLLIIETVGLSTEVVSWVTYADSRVFFMAAAMLMLAALISAVLALTQDTVEQENGGPTRGMWWIIGGINFFSALALFAHVISTHSSQILY